MSQELIYTSSPKGLKLGARGFCTVASTPGMTKNLADRLESLSGYRHLHPPGSPEAHLNPVNFSYLRFVLGGQTYYLLSRTADAGLDYTQRTNKLAHHIALQQKELPSAGPAWLASQSGVFETSWNREPEHLASGGRRIPQDQLNADICSAWKTVTGDAGWAGVLAEHLLTHPSSEAYLIYTSGTDILELFTEAQALLSPDQRWEATFTTYFTKLPPGVECRWRGVVEGTPEALRARRSPGLLVIDFSGPLGRAPDSELVTLARTGKRHALHSLPNSIETLDDLQGTVKLRGNRADEVHLLEHPTNRQSTPLISSTPPKLPSQRSVLSSGPDGLPSGSRRKVVIAAALLLAMTIGAGISAALLYSFNVSANKVQLLAQEPGSQKTDIEVEQHKTVATDERSELSNSAASTSQSAMGNDDETARGENHEELRTSAAQSVSSNSAQEHTAGPPTYNGNDPVAEAPPTTEAKQSQVEIASPDDSSNNPQIPDDIFDRIKGEIELHKVPDQQVEIAGDSWLEPIEVGKLPMGKPPLRIQLIGMENKVLELKDAQNDGHFLLQVADNTPAEVQIGGEPTTLNFRWLPEAQGVPKPKLDWIRSGILVLSVTVPDVAIKPCLVSLTPIVHGDSLKFNKALDPISFQVPQSLQSDKSIVHYRVTDIPGQSDPQGVKGKINQIKPSLISFGPDDTLELKLTLETSKNSIGIVRVELDARNALGKTSPLAQVLRTQEKQRREYLIDASVAYVRDTPGQWSNWESKDVPMSGILQGPPTRQTRLPIFDENAQKRFRVLLKRKHSSIDELNKIERKLQKETKHDRYIDLEDHEKEYPYLSEWNTIANELAGSTGIHLRVARQIGISDGMADQEVTVLEAGDP